MGEPSAPAQALASAVMASASTARVRGPRKRSTAPAAPRVRQPRPLAPFRRIWQFSAFHLGERNCCAPHDLSDGQRRRNWKSWRSALATPFQEADGTGGVQFRRQRQAITRSLSETDDSRVLAPVTAWGLLQSDADTPRRQCANSRRSVWAICDRGSNGRDVIRAPPGRGSVCLVG